MVVAVAPTTDSGAAQLRLQVHPQLQVTHHYAVADIAQPSRISRPLAGGTQDHAAPELPDDGWEAPIFAESYRLVGELPRGYWLTAQLPVRVVLESGEFVAQAQLLDLHAFGDSPIEAIINLRDELVDYCDELEAMGDRLAPRLVRQRELLRQLIIRDAQP